MQHSTIGLALSGGGIKAYAQIPFLRWLESQQIEISAYAGTSMGAIIATLAATQCSVDELEAKMIELESYFVENKVFYRPSIKVLPFIKDKSDGLIDGAPLEKLLETTFASLGVHHMKDLKKPCAITSVDLVSGNLVVFTNRPKWFVKKDWIVIEDISIAAALRASCSVPLVFTTKRIGHLFCVDGGVLMNLPTQLCAHLKVERILTVSMQDEQGHIPNDSITGVLMRSFEIFSHASVVNSAQQSDLCFNVPLSKFNFMDVKMGKEIIELSEQLIEEKKDDMLKTIQSWKKTNVIRRIIDGI